MVKKHLITCSVIFVLVNIFSFLVFGKTPKKHHPKNAKSAHQANAIFISNADTNQFSFANESIPVDDPEINNKIGHSLKQHSYKTIHSNILHFKAGQWFPIIEPILKKYGIPEDFKYVPLVESGLCEGTSKRGAGGLWQFMPGTARTYGLKVGKGKDERMDIRKATVAACKYIKELYGEFNSWTLAAAAYNIGEIKLAKAINKQSEDNYYRMHFNSETATYVYKLIAMKEIINKPGQYGYKGVFFDPKPMGVLASN